MARAFGAGINLFYTQALNFVIQNLSAAPSGAPAGHAYYDTTRGGWFFKNATVYRPADPALLSDGSIPNAALAPIANSLLITNPLLRGNHQGTQTANTISNLQATVLAYTLDTFAAPVSTVNFNNQRATGAANATAATDLVPLAQLQSYVISMIAGQTAIKNPVRAYAAGNITLSGLQTVDGVSLAAGDRVAAGGQTAGSQINIYAAASGAWTIATDCSSAGSWIEGTEFLVTEGATYAGSIFRQTTSGTITVGTTTMSFVQTAKINTYTADGTTLSLIGTQFGVRVAAGGGIVVGANGIQADTTVIARKASGTFNSDGSTTSSWTFSHNLGTSNLLVGFKDSNNANWDFDWVPTSGATTTQISITAASPPPSSTYTVFAIG